MSSTRQSQLPVEDSEQAQQNSSEETLRPPLAPSEKNNVVSRKPRTREITSRYKSPITSSLDTPSVPSSARRSPSPKVSKTDPVSTRSFLKRAQSAERRRPSTTSFLSRPSTPPNNSSLSNGLAEMQISSKRLLGRSQEGLWPSTRTLCVSFQTDTFTLPITKRERSVTHVSDYTLKPWANVARKLPETPAPQRKVTTPERKRTPLRGKNADQLENSKPSENSHSRAVDRHMWPSRSTGKTSGNALNRSVDLTDKSNKAATLLLQGRGVSVMTRTPTSDAVTRGLQQSMNEGPVGRVRSNVARRVSFDGGEVSEMRIVDGTSLRASSLGDSHFTVDRPSQISSLSHHAELYNTEGTPFEVKSGTGSFSSSSNLILQEEIGSLHSSFTGRDSSRWKGVPAPNFRHRPVLLPSLPDSDSSSVASVLPRRTKVVSSSTGVSSSSSLERASSTPCSSRSQSSPLRGLHHPPSSSKAIVSSSTPSRGMTSPSRSRWTSAPSASPNSTGNSSSVLNFVADVRKGKKGANYIEEAHQLRILYNRYLQWRFINAQADASLSIQQLTVEKLFYDVWNNASELRDSVTLKRIYLQRSRQSIKINSILKKQMPCLDDWALLEREHSDSLSGAIEALEASTLRLPVTGGARADTQILRDAISSAVDMIQTTGSSICFLLSKVEEVNSLVSELAEVAAKERTLLEECGDLLEATSALQVEEWSLRTHLIQLKHMEEQPNMGVE